MGAKRRKHHSRTEAGAKGDQDVVREFRTVNRGLLALGLVMTVVAVFIAPVTVRSLCILINRGGFVEDAFEIEFLHEGTRVSSRRLEGRIVSSGERFVTKRIDLVGGEQRRQLAAQGSIPGHRLPVWYLPRRGVWAWVDRVADFRLLSQAEFETPLAFDMGFGAVNIALALGGALLVRREIRRALKERSSQE